MSRAASGLVGLLAILACGRGGPSKSDAADTSAIIVPPDPAIVVSSTSPVMTDDRMVALRDSLARFPDHPRTADWLWELGNLMLTRHSVVGVNGPDTAFARTHPDEFAYSDPDAAYFYTRFHFRELLRRFPEDTLADEAAYRLADPVEGGECEGSVPCIIEYRQAFIGLNAFLRRFPRSEYAGKAVERVNDAFLSTLGSADVDDQERLAPRTVDSLLTSYSTTAARLPDSLRASAQSAIAKARQVLDSLVRAHH